MLHMHLPVPNDPPSLKKYKHPSHVMDNPSTPCRFIGMLI